MISHPCTTVLHYAYICTTCEMLYSCEPLFNKRVHIGFLFIMNDIILSSKYITNISTIIQERQHLIVP